MNSKYSIEVNRNRVPAINRHGNPAEGFDYMADVRSTVTGVVVHTTRRYDTAQEARQEAMDWIRSQKR